MPYTLARPQTRCTSMYPGYEQLENTESGNGIRESFRLHGMCVLVLLMLLCTFKYRILDT